MNLKPISCQDIESLFQDLNELLLHPLNKLVDKDECNNLYVVDKRHKLYRSMGKKELDKIFLVVLDWLCSHNISLIINSDTSNLFNYEGYLAFKDFSSLCSGRANHPFIVIIESYLTALEYMSEDLNV